MELAIPSLILTLKRPANTESAISPAMAASTIFTAIRDNISLKSALLDSNMGIASSDVDMNTAAKVPAEIILPAYRFDAATENPHWGTLPRTAPPTTPNFLRPSTNLSDDLCSIYSSVK
jgi:hypothetical protein